MPKLKGEIVTTWQDAQNAWIALGVDEPQGRTEYNASVPLTNRVDSDGNDLPDFLTLSSDKQLAELLEAAKAVRNAALAPQQALTFSKRSVTLE